MSTTLQLKIKIKHLKTAARLTKVFRTQVSYPHLAQLLRQLTGKGNRLDNF